MIRLLRNVLFLLSPYFLPVFSLDGLQKKMRPLCRRGRKPYNHGGRYWESPCSIPDNICWTLFGVFWDDWHNHLEICLALELSSLIWTLFFDRLVFSVVVTRQSCPRSNFFRCFQSHCLRSLHRFVCHMMLYIMLIII